MGLASNKILFSSTHSQLMKKSDFNYELPTHLIAQQPLPERTASRLLYLHRQTGKYQDKQFNEFIDLVNPGDVLVFNDTKVIPARLFGKKQTGGHVEILIERILDSHLAVAHVRASKTPKPGTLITLEKHHSCRVLGREGDLFILQFLNDQPLLAFLEEVGHIPLPPYIDRADDSNDLDRYQTVFAKQAGAVAAPTAGLHFDQTLLDALATKGINKAFVTLHVGSGTFQPVRVENLSEHRMHCEYYEVSETAVDIIKQTRRQGGRVIAVGTTALRALESASLTGSLQSGCGDTDLFITPGYTFKTVDALLTNFHLPESTLLMLISAFAGYEAVMQAYRHAIDESYRFFSYGDAMFLWE